MRILVTGGQGLLAHALRSLASPTHMLEVLGRGEFDLLQPDSMRTALDRLQPEVVINTAAYNAVDQCEVERDLSWSVNATAPGVLARLCAERAICLVHYGSDYVFDGGKDTPYVETDAHAPLNHYGVGKLAGEVAVLAGSSSNLVLRTSWVFGGHPTQTKSYPHTVLRMAKAGLVLRATTDQISAPTFAQDLAAWTLALIEQGAQGLFHAVNDEPLSRYAWTCAILERIKALGLVRELVSVEGVPTSYFNPKIRRPGYSALSNQRLSAALGRPLGSWRTGLERFLAEEQLRAAEGVS